MKLRGRIDKLETKSPLAPAEPTREDAIRWTRRFIAADHSHSEILRDIRAWGAKHRIEYIYADRTDEIHAGEFMKALFFTLYHPATSLHGWPRRGYGEGGVLMERFAPLLHEYMRTTGDVFPLAYHGVDLLAGDGGADFLDYCLRLCKFAAEKAICSSLTIP